MKLFISMMVVVWLLCGFAGAWILDDLDADHWQLIAKGPLTLIRAVNDSPTIYPGP